jgi:hypothetical protein
MQCAAIMSELGDRDVRSQDSRQKFEILRQKELANESIGDLRARTELEAGYHVAVMRVQRSQCGFVGRLDRKIRFRKMLKSNPGG